MDHACERLVVEALRRERPGDAIVAEEGSGEDLPDARFRWIIDPLDGTVNFAHGYPRFCVSIGVEREGERHVGVVYDPILDELFHAVRGAGAFVNGERIHVSEETELGRALLATGFAYDARGREENLVHFGAFMNRTRGLRRDGSAALDLSYVACGRLDGFWELHLHPWDVAAGFLLGVLQSFASMNEVKSLIPGIDQIVIYLVAVAVLLIRPRGLMGRKGVMEA